ncbi:hypothetical protein K505DRAFT_318523 [Melanomma pulvis-pyrius CBS 109.77]|uniref:Rhodopsin domain-containing protein n=1 Tax=Melanomma pulvis-pyrius CBS 109.77 TaxID=1314802 RepID=A0A6A6WQN8_9PLEO|nr:hypothetical protein K505DRAFT_318523 [Melanomma pulvis-pyrius CBS 109.77]
MPAWTLESVREAAVAKRQAASSPVYAPDDTNAPEILTITGTFFAVAALVVLLRCYVRISMLKVFGVDDYLMVVALILAAAVFACFNMETHYGIGKHFLVLIADPANFMKITHILYFHSLIIMIGVSTVKISIAFFLLRLAPRKSHAMFLYGVIAAWNSALRPPPFGTGTAKCYSNNVFRNLGMMNSAFNIITDVLFATLPIPLIWSLQLNTRTKISLIAILSLGWFACAAAIVKAVQQFHVLDDLNWTYKDSFNIWNYIEFTIGILASSLPTLKPLFNWALDTARAITSAGRTHGSGLRGNGQKGALSLGYHKTSDTSSKSVELHSVTTKGGSPRGPYNVEISGKPTGIAERDVWEMERGKSSEESILPLQHPEPGKNRIVRTTEVRVS